MELREALATIRPLSDDTFNQLCSITHERVVRKGECVISQGERSRSFLFIKKGVFRLWFVANGKERTTGFGVPGDPFTSICTLISNEPAIQSFEAVTDAEIYYIDHEDLKKLMNDSKEFTDWMLAFTLEQLSALYAKNVIFGTHKAAKRFEAFVLARPEVYKVVSAKHLAQYLNIAPETLSRIQNTLLRKKTSDC